MEWIVWWCVCVSVLGSLQNLYVARNSMEGDAASNVRHCMSLCVVYGFFFPPRFWKNACERKSTIDSLCMSQQRMSVICFNQISAQIYKKDYKKKRSLLQLNQSTFFFSRNCSVACCQGIFKKCTKILNFFICTRIWQETFLVNVTNLAILNPENLIWIPNSCRISRQLYICVLETKPVFAR